MFDTCQAKIGVDAGEDPPSPCILNHGHQQPHCAEIQGHTPEGKQVTALITWKTN